MPKTRNAKESDCSMRPHFLNALSRLRLAGALLMEIHKDRQTGKRYFDMNVENAPLPPYRKKQFT
jgi:hypothetical protein